MAYNISDELRHSFGLASLQREASKILTAKEWKDFQAIQKKYTDIGRSEHRIYELEYTTRVEVAKKRLINKAGSKTKTFNHPWARNDRFDKAAINRQAHRHVRNQHMQLMSHLDAQKYNETKSLMDSSKSRRALKEKPKRDFNRAADRRKNIDRRQSQTHKRSR
uniref:Uncharacterized protein n=1 Tax=OCS116 cluster bacterium TaxID=2030921 RepID=A0A2A4YYX0_9PROT